ncbi:MAG: DNRLRE domain-containing protein [Desulfobacterales bacterium]|nr:DNRLRE domain-containing protein [Desulfobacterales bacterium]
MVKNIMGKWRGAWVLFFILCIVSGRSVYCQEIIFRPAPGLNNGTDNGSVNAGKDALGGTCDNPGYNGGASAAILAAPITICNSCNTNLYIEFNLDSLPADVSHVYLGFTHLPHTDYCLSNCNADFYFYPISQPWNEMTVTLNNAPSHGPAVFGPINITFPNDFGKREYEITDLYRQWKNGTIPNYGIEISSTTTGCNNAAVIFYVHSSDAEDPAERPYLRCVKDLSSDYDMDDYSENQGDCNDEDTSIHPGAPEMCGDGKDNNCNGAIDEGCAIMISPPSALTARAASSGRTIRQMKPDLRLKRRLEAAALMAYGSRSQ